MAVIDHFFHNFSEYLESNEEIQELLECYKVTDGVDNTLCERYVNKMDKGGDGSTPGLVGLRISTIAKLLATFVPTILKIKNKVVKGHWKDLLHRRYFYRFLDVSLIGFKIVENDLDKHDWVVLTLTWTRRKYPKILSFLPMSRVARRTTLTSTRKIPRLP